MASVRPRRPSSKNFLGTMILSGSTPNTHESLERDRDPHDPLPLARLAHSSSCGSRVSERAKKAST